MPDVMVPPQCVATVATGIGRAPTVSATNALQCRMRIGAALVLVAFLASVSRGGCCTHRRLGLAINCNKRQTQIMRGSEWNIRTGSSISSIQNLRTRKTSLHCNRQRFSPICTGYFLFHRKEALIPHHVHSASARGFRDAGPLCMADTSPSFAKGRVG